MTSTDVADEIIATIARWIDKDVIPYASGFEHADEFPQSMFDQMCEFGLFGATIPEEYGGLGLDITTYARIIEELSRGWMSLSGISEHPQNRRNHDRSVRNRRSATEVPAEDGGRNVPGCVFTVGARLRQRCRRAAVQSDRGRQRMDHQRNKSVGDQRCSCVDRDAPGPNARRSDHMLHRREGTRRRVRGDSRLEEDQQARLQGPRDGGDDLRGPQGSCIQPARWAGGD